MIERVILVTKKTAQEELVARFNTWAQAKFYIRQQGEAVDEYEAAHHQYVQAVTLLKSLIPKQLKVQVIERAFLPNYLFGPNDLVVTIGPDGLVVNAAKYLTTQWILAVNPDPQRVDGVLLPFQVAEVGEWLARAVTGRINIRPVTMAKATLNTGQALYAFNDLFIGPRTHTSLRYRLEYAGRAEDQSSSGIIVSTGAGSTGWLQSIVTGSVRVAAGVLHQDFTPPAPESYRLPWEADELYFTVREPFTSRTSRANVVFGRLTPSQPLLVRSQTPENGVIFSDGLEQDSLQFNAGTVAQIAIAERKVQLILKN